jgi:hypothetical protein
MKSGLVMERDKGEKKELGGQRGKQAKKLTGANGSRRDLNLYQSFVALGSGWVLKNGGQIYLCTWAG